MFYCFSCYDSELLCICICWMSHAPLLVILWFCDCLKTCLPAQVRGCLLPFNYISLRVNNLCFTLVASLVEVIYPIVKSCAYLFFTVITFVTVLISLFWRILSWCCWSYGTVGKYTVCLQPGTYCKSAIYVTVVLFRLLLSKIRNIFLSYLLL